VSLLLIAVAAAVICWVPVPLRSRAEGVIWIPERAIVRANTDGFVAQVAAQPGAWVRQGEVLILCQDLALTTRVQVLEARRQELWTRYTVKWLEEPVQAEIIKEEITLVEETLARARERVADLTIRSRAAGTFVVPQVQDLPGQFVRQGTQLAYVLDLSTLTARVVVSQAEIDLVRYRVQGVAVRLAERLDTAIPATIIREVPGATEQLPSLALASQGGGSIATDPFDTKNVKALQKLFQFDLALPASAGVVNVGGRVYVRFDHGWEPLLQRWYQYIRRLFLAKFSI